MLDMMQILEVLILRLHNNLLLVIKGCDSNFEPKANTVQTIVIVFILISFNSIAKGINSDCQITL